MTMLMNIETGLIDTEDNFRWELYEDEFMNLWKDKTLVEVIYNKEKKCWEELGGNITMKKLSVKCSCDIANYPFVAQTKEELPNCLHCNGLGYITVQISEHELCQPQPRE